MSGDLHTAWARLFVRALAASGVENVVVSPGSRSTPLVLAVAREERLRCHVVLDERSAAFFALGQARASGRPSALVCTSGTAGAHYLAAVIEASLSFTPLVVITADRPWDAYDAAAPQTIDQVKLFGAHVRHYAELGLPDASPAALRAVQRIAAQAVHTACGSTPGPVHVNARFRKPLEPVPSVDVAPWHADVEALLARGPTRANFAAPAADANHARDLAEACAKSTRGLIVCGPAPATGDLDAHRAAVSALARATGFPLLPEGTSQMRFGAPLTGVIACSSFDAVLRDAAFTSHHAPDLILEVGAPPVSTAYAAFLDASPHAARCVLASHGWNDPRGDATALFLGDPYALARAVVDRLKQVPSPATREWSEAFAQKDAAVTRRIAAELDLGRLTEGSIAHDVIDLLPDGAALVVSNSNPVRDLDLYAPTSRRAVRVLHQRGASGIDGLVSGAAGARSVAKGSVALFLGDLAFAHDVGGLATARAVSGPMPIVVVQNRGGRIFEQLPLAGSIDAHEFERLFATPQELDILHAAHAFGLEHRRVETRAAFRTAMKDALVSSVPMVIEAVVPPHDAAARRRAIWSAA